MQREMVGNNKVVGSGSGSAANNEDEAAGGGGNYKEQEHLEQLLPIANVGRIMKQILPPNAKISKEAKETLQECVSEFISFVTCEASDKCRKERRKTVNGDDVCWALGALGFDDYAGPLRTYLHRYREQEGANNNNQDNQEAANNTTEDDDHQRMLFNHAPNIESPNFYQGSSTGL